MNSCGLRFKTSSPREALRLMKSSSGQYAEAGRLLTRSNITPQELRNLASNSASAKGFVR